MSQETPQEETFTMDELLNFMKLKREALERTVRCRTEAADSYRNGTSAEWRAVGCRMTEEERMKTSNMYMAIALAQSKEVAMYDAVIDVLSTASQSRSGLIQTKD